MKVELFDERGIVECYPSDIDNIMLESDGYSILVTWSNGIIDRAKGISL